MLMGVACGSARMWTISVYCAVAAVSLSTQKVDISQELCHFAHPVKKVSSNIPSKRANKLALRVVSHGTQTLSLPPKWQHIHMGAFSYPDERFLL